jgi:menaquinone-9 beta-reductase
MFPDENRFDLIIVGCGPSGCTTALNLAATGLKIALIDKSTLPKAKVCGDALSGTVMKVLKDLPGNAYREFLEMPGILPSWGIRFFAPNQVVLDVPFVKNKNEQTLVPGVTCSRTHFEEFMLKKLEGYSNIQLFLGCTVKEIRVSHSTGEITVAGDAFHFTSNVVVGADGTNSIVGKKLAGNRVDLKKLCLGVRGYYSGVTELHEDNFIELHFIRELLPDYLWIFPMQGGIANVGLGMMSNRVKMSRVSPANVLKELLRSHPNLRSRFLQATLLGKIETHSLPMGPDKKRISGQGFLLTGDAASLIDPFTGEGIGNAMVSGEIAAKLLQRAFAENDFSKRFFQQYDHEIKTRIGKELKISSTIRKLVAFPSLFNFVAKKVNSREDLTELFSSMYYELEARKKLMNPLFYLTMVTDPLKTSSS